MPEMKGIRPLPTKERLPIPPPGFVPLIAGLRDFSILFDTHPRTPDTWQTRGHLPIPDGVISGRYMFWLVSRLEVWAHNMGLQIYPERLIEARERDESYRRRAPTPLRDEPSRAPLAMTKRRNKSRYVS